MARFLVVFSSFSSIDLGAHPAPSLAVQGRRRCPPLTAARCHRDTSLSLLLAVRLWGELCLALEHAVRAPPAPLRPCLVGAALRRRRSRRARHAHTRATRHGQGPAWVGRLPNGAYLSASGPALLGALSIFKHVYFSSDFAKSVEIRV